MRAHQKPAARDAGAAFDSAASRRRPRPFHLAVEWRGRRESTTRRAFPTGPTALRNILTVDANRQQTGQTSTVVREHLAGRRDSVYALAPPRVAMEWQRETPRMTESVCCGSARILLMKRLRPTRRTRPRLVASTHNPLVPGSHPGGPIRQSLLPGASSFRRLSSPVSTAAPVEFSSRVPCPLPR